MYEYRATLERVVDGDTVIMTIDLGMDVQLKHQNCRSLFATLGKAGLAIWKLNEKGYWRRRSPKSS